MLSVLKEQNSNGRKMSVVNNTLGKSMLHYSYIFISNACVGQSMKVFWVLEGVQCNVNFCLLMSIETQGHSHEPLRVLCWCHAHSDLFQLSSAGTVLISNSDNKMTIGTSNWEETDSSEWCLSSAHSQECVCHSYKLVRSAFNPVLMWQSGISNPSYTER